MSVVIKCLVTRRGREWVTHVAEHGVYGHGRTLKKLSEDVLAGLELVGVAAEIELIAVTPELEKLRAVEETREAALRDAVTALALRRATLRDIALATGLPMARVKRVLQERRSIPAEVSGGRPEVSDGADGPPPGAEAVDVVRPADEDPQGRPDSVAE
ncbi:hypothetical protein [Kitasatospora sp. NPDC058046]|uniref:hypothetical protein n=1 Tax=Kitasatospora sp. NPDC058046 TaxID=3346312 RepID=UPI0036DF3C3F